MALLQKEIGGYSIFADAGLPVLDSFGFNDGKAHLFSLGRHCLRAIWESLKPRRLVLPHYTCHSVKNLAKSLGMDVSYYNLGEDFVPRHANMGLRDVCVINNYFGLAASVPEWSTFLQESDPECWVVDNTQSLCAGNQFQGRWSFMSPRKFLPVTDGGILFGPEQREINESVLPHARDVSWERIHWLFRAIDEDGRMNSYPSYARYRQQDVQAIEYAQMSGVTKHLLQIYDVGSIIRERNRKFSLMRSVIPIHHQFDRLCLGTEACPIGYPVKVKNAAEAQTALAKQNIYGIRYWPELAGSDDLNSFERSLVDCTLILPIDDRYSERHVSMILDEIQDTSSHTARMP